MFLLLVYYIKLIINQSVNQWTSFNKMLYAVVYIEGLLQGVFSLMQKQIELLILSSLKK